MTTTTARRKISYSADLPPITAADAEAERDRLTFPEPRPAEKDITIQIDAGPDGLRVRCAYVGPLSSIPAAVEQLRAAGVLELVSAARCNSQPEKRTTKAAESVSYGDDGIPLCKYHGPMRESTKAPGSWYCAHKLQDGSYCKERA